MLRRRRQACQAVRSLSPQPKQSVHVNRRLSSASGARQDGTPTDEIGRRCYSNPIRWGTVDSNFWCVPSSITHTMWLSMCMCCGLFAPTQFQFECCETVTIHDNKKRKNKKVFIRNVAKNMKLLWKVAQIVRKKVLVDTFQKIDGGTGCGVGQRRQGSCQERIALSGQQEPTTSRWRSGSGARGRARSPPSQRGITSRLMRSRQRRCLRRFEFPLRFVQYMSRCLASLVYGTATFRDAAGRLLCG